MRLSELADKLEKREQYRVLLRVKERAAVIAALRELAYWREQDVALTQNWAQEWAIEDGRPVHVPITRHVVNARAATDAALAKIGEGK